MKRIFSIICLVSFVLFADSNLVSDESNIHFHGKGILKDQPFLNIKMEMSGSRYEIRINDVPIKEEKIGYPIIARRPINYWLKSGKNIVSVHLYPLPDELDLSKNLKCDVQLRVRRSDANDSDNQTIARISYVKNNIGKEAESSSPAGRFNSGANFSLSEHGDVVVSELTVKPSSDSRGLILSRTVDLPLPFPKWKWFESDSIPNGEKTKKELYQQYVAIFNALKNKKIDQLVSGFGERNEEYMKSLYATEDMNIELKKNFMEQVNDPEKTLWDTGWNDSELEVFGNGRLARLTDWEGRPYIAFVNKENTSSTEYDIIFRKSGDQWIITR